MQGEFTVHISWRTAPEEPEQEDDLILRWDKETLQRGFHEVEEEIRIASELNLNQAVKTEAAAVAIAAAVMEHIQRGCRFTTIADMGSFHDFFLNDDEEQMIEVAGRWEGGLPGLFEEKLAQSRRNPLLRQRWVSVTVLTQTARNRTERVSR